MPETTTYAVGDELRGPTRAMTLRRIGWYSVGMLTAGTGEVQPVQHNIHTDHEYARGQGLPAAIADGMHSANWISAMLTDHFGTAYISNGALRTKFIKPVFVDVPLTACAVVTERTETDGEIEYQLDVWCEDPEGTRLTVGEASVRLPAAR